MVGAGAPGNAALAASLHDLQGLLTRGGRVGLASMRSVTLASCLLWTATALAIELELPIACEIGRSCAIQQYVDHDASQAARDYQCGTLTYDQHNGTDFRLPSLVAQRRGIGVLAAAEGRVLRTRVDMPDAGVNAPDAPRPAGFECGNGLIVTHDDGWETQYCHLAQHSVSPKPGERVSAGQPLGLVGLSGRTEFPHLHFTVRHQGQIVDPFAFGAASGSCGGGASLWKPAIRAALTYRPRAVLNAGFADGAVTMEQIEAGEAGRVPPDDSAPALVAFVRAIGLKAGDAQRLAISGPDGASLADHAEKPLERDKAQVMLFAGRKRPPTGWLPGPYRARYRVIRDGEVVLESSFETQL
jgi:murein DD-endopeptidase MepM/ murein hydrolase activator NlpD